MKIAKTAIKSNCWVSSRPPLGITNPAMIDVFIPYNITINQSAPINASLNVRLAHPYDTFWESGVGKRFSSKDDFFCKQLMSVVNMENLVLDID